MVVCSSNNSHQGLLLQETEGKETFICPLSTTWALPSERHKWSVAGDGRAGGLGGGWFSSQAWRLLPEEAGGRTFVYLCVHPTP